MATKMLRIATRNSPLALWQAQHVANEITKYWPSLRTQLVPMTTSGDTLLHDKRVSVSGKGLFVKELEDALLHHRADIAVHSMKDVPATCPEGLAITTMCKRENPYDAFVSHLYPSLNTLPFGALLGTSSLRRQSQALAARPDLRVVSLRGNINTRLAKLEAGEFDAIILAVSGLVRLDKQHDIKHIFSDDIMLPACGQGALGIECRMDDVALHQLMTPLNDPITTRCVQSERRVSALLGGNCHVPLAVHCQMVNDTQLLLQAKVASSDGKTILYARQTGSLDHAMQLADDCAHELVNKGAKKLLHILPH